MQERVTPLVFEMLRTAGCEREFIAAVKGHEGWTMSDDEAWRRIRQCARPHRADRPLPGRRHFDAEWLAIAVRLVAIYGGDDVASASLKRARAEGLREGVRRRPYRVSPRDRKGRETA